MDLRIGDIGIKRIFSIYGLIFILILLFFIEKQTNFFYYLSVERKIDLLKKINTDTSHLDLSQRINEEYSKIIDDLSSTKLFKINEIEKSIKEITNRLKYGKENLTEQDKEKIIEQLNGEIKNLKKQLENQRGTFFFIGLLTIPFIFVVVLVGDKIYSYVKTKRSIKSSDQKNDTENSKNKSVKNEEYKQQNKDNGKSNSQTEDN